MSDQPQAQCTGCQRVVKAKPTKDGAGVKTPMGWRALPDGLLCPECVRSRYYIRGFRVAIRGVVGSEKDSRDATDFRAALVAASSATARFANWYVQRLYAKDLAAAPALEKTKDGKTKLPKATEVDYYRDATLRFPELAPASIVAVAKMVRGWYVSDRFGALVALNRSVRSYRFGDLPVEIPKQAWSLVADDDGKFAIRTQVGPGKSWTVAIGCDRYALPRLKALASGEATAMALKIVRASKTPLAGGGKPTKAWFFRISAMFPRKAKRNQIAEKTLTLGHDAGCLLFGSLEDSEDVFEYGGESLRTTIVGGDRADRKMQIENSLLRADRMPRRKLLRWQKDRTRQCQNRARKVNAKIKLAAATLTRWCVSHGVTSVDYDAQDRGFLPHFPYYALKSAMTSALETEGIGLHTTNETEQEALAGPGSETDVSV